MSDSRDYKNILFGSNLSSMIQSQSSQSTEESSQSSSSQ